jgi:hypothetical protein
VSSICWSPSGSTIAIAYEDGAVIVGSVEGNRLWSKDLGTGLSHVVWSPSGRMLLFGTTTGEVLAYDAAGNPVSKVELNRSQASAGGLRSCPETAAAAATPAAAAARAISSPQLPGLSESNDSGHSQRSTSERPGLACLTGCACRLGRKSDRAGVV